MLQAQRGLTLIEIMIAVAIFSVVTVVVTGLLFSTTSFFEYTVQDAYMFDRAQSAMAFVYGELADVYEGDLRGEDVATGFVLTYTQSVGWSTSAPVSGQAKRFEWDRGRRAVFWVDENGVRRFLLADVSGFRVVTQSLDHPNEYFIFITMSKWIDTPQGADWVTQTFVQSRRLLRKP